MKLTPQKEKFALGLILLIALFLRIYKLPTLMAFGGDVARDFLAARDITLKGEIPLLGSPSSVPWLHQGAFFTYLLGVVLLMGKYNPVAGGYFVGVLGVLGVLGVFFLGKTLFSTKVGLLSAFFYATSPLVVIFDRYPYHQSLISLFTILFFFFLLFSIKNANFFPNFLILSSFVLGLLLQLELSNLVLIPVLLVFLFNCRESVNFKILMFSFLAFVLTWLPKIIYDLGNGFTQTVGFAAWVVHKLPLVSYFLGEKGGVMSLGGRIEAICLSLSRIIFWPSPIISMLIFLGGLGVLGKGRHNKEAGRLIFLWLVFPVLGFIIQGSPSEAYMPVLFGAISLMVGLAVSCLGKLERVAGTGILILLGIFNSFLLISHDYFLLTGERNDDQKKYNLGHSYELVKNVADFIVKDSLGERFNLLPFGNYDYYSSAKLNLVYLTWYLGNAPRQNKEKLLYFVYNRNEGIKIAAAKKVKDFPYLTVARKNRND